MWIHSVKKQNRQNSSAFALFGTIFVGEIEQKQTILFIKCNNINLFIELLHKINIIFAIVLIFWKTPHSCWFDIAELYHMI